MFQNSLFRPLVGLPIAAFIVVGLFSFMKSMISSEFTPPKAAEAREIVVLTMPEEVLERPHATPRPERIDLAAPPPRAPRYQASADAVPLSQVAFTPVDADLGSAGLFDRLVISPVAINERDARPIQPPNPVYPSAMQARGIEGSCEVHLNVDPQGRPFNVEAICSHDGFRREAERAVKQVRFVPKIEKGTPVTRTGVVYPLEFGIVG